MFLVFRFSGYWEGLLQQLKAVMAKTRLKERHQKMLKGKLEEMKMEVTMMALLTLFCNFSKRLPLVKNNVLEFLERG